MRGVFDTIIRRLYRTVLREDTRHYLTSLSLLKLLLMVGDRRPPLELIANFDAKPVVVLAPHMDDEVLGCGGAARKHVLSGAQVTTVYLTDGRRGNPDLYRQRLAKSIILQEESKLASVRKDEAAKAAKIVGVQELIFLEGPDGSLEPSPSIVKRLREILQQKSPAVIYHPSLFDLHHDHWTTNCVLHEATKTLSFSECWKPVYRGYEVWSPLLANRIVDISEVIETKKSALAHFESQMSQTDFIRALLGLNAYRSLYHFRGRGYAEAFCESTPEEYRLFFERLEGR